MKRVMLSIITVLALVLPASAQVEVDLVTEQRHFLAGEELRVGVRIANLSGQTLRFGETADWVSFLFDPNAHMRARPIADLPAIEPFEVQNATRATRWFNLTPYFDLERVGEYRCSAIIKIQQWKEERSTQPVSLQIVNGTAVWSQDFGLPLAPGAPPTPPEFRTYTLEKARLGDDAWLYLRVIDKANHRTIRVVGIDRMPQISKPEMQIDRQGQLHVLHQTDRSAFNYSAFTPDGALILRQRHGHNEFTRSRPVLRPMEDGTVIIHGGARKMAPTDFPPSEGVTLN